MIARKHSQPVARKALGVEETAHALGFGRTLIFRLIKEGKLKTIKIGGRRLVLVAEIDRLLSESEAS